MVIIGDFCLLAAGLSGLAAVWQPDFAGLISNDISEVLLAVTCACVFLGAIFVPDQRRYQMKCRSKQVRRLSLAPFIAEQGQINAHGGHAFFI